MPGNAAAVRAVSLSPSDTDYYHHGAFYANNAKHVCLSRDHERLGEIESCAVKALECPHLTVSMLD
jgi:hypothetical protein